MYTRQLPVGSTYTASKHSALAGSSAAASTAMAAAPALVHAPRTHVRRAPVYVYQQVAPTNSAAIAALVLSLISFTTSFFLAGIIGIVFGHIARSQIKSRGERGNGMAVAGLWIGYLSVIFWIVFWLIYFGVIALLVGFAVAVESAGY